MQCGYTPRCSRAKPLVLFEVVKNSPYELCSFGPFCSFAQRFCIRCCTDAWFSTEVQAFVNNTAEMENYTTASVPRHPPPLSVSHVSHSTIHDSSQKNLAYMYKCFVFFRRKLYWHSWNFTIIDAFAVDSRLMTVSSFHCWTGITLFVPSDVMSLASVKSRLVLPFWYWLTQVVLDKGPLNGCVCVCVCVLTSYCQ